MNARSADLVAYTLLVGAALAGLLLWPALPDSMAIHFGAGGEPDSFVAKPIAMVLTPAIGVVAVLLVRYAPEWASRTRSPYVETLSVVFVASVIAYVQGFVYAWNLGYRLSMWAVLAPVLLVAAAFVAYTYTREGTPS
jgi:uncharacterized membrane protein